MSTATSSREQELLDRIASLGESLNKSVHVNIEHATFQGLKDFIREMYQPLENDGAVLNFINDGVDIH
ncbi:3011_t:CDS:2 [Funneliformis caledonium]|uniref:3011_t:CDS:1 n=1 Tax=Funneliformis caledonium TaxID=1117310 RepID=A0A9N9FIA6_9GLOM|nr:3011_t:CDS:2 [Funneliformis caledonium]